MGAAEGRREADALYRPEATVHENGLAEGDCNDPFAEIFHAAAFLQLALYNDNGL